MVATRTIGWTAGVLAAGVLAVLVVVMSSWPGPAASESSPDPATAGGAAQPAGGGRDPSASGQAREKPAGRKAQAADPDEAAQAGRGVFVRKKGAARFQFVPGHTEEKLNQILANMRFAGGGVVHFAPGTYTIHQSLKINNIPDLTVSGSPGVVLEFADGPEVIPLTLAPVENGATVIQMDRTEDIRVGWRYQLYAPKRDSTRVLEFEVKSVEGQEVHLTRPVKYMPRIKEIPAGSRVLEELNIFKIRNCPRIVIENLVMDGKNRGPVRGHTLYGGLYMVGDYTPGARPKTIGATIRGCTFRGLKGRGICAYGIGDVRIENCGFFDIRAQAMEIDHYSSGHVLNNFVDGAEMGVMVNDAFETIVEGNVLRRCLFGVKIVKIFPEEWVNTGNIVRDNIIGPGCGNGVFFQDDITDGITGNFIRKNQFIGLKEARRIVNGDGNTIEK